MHRSCLLILGLLLIATPVLGQSASTDSQTLQALLSEVRQLRHDLQTTTLAAQRAQILLYRLQGQEQSSHAHRKDSMTPAQDSPRFKPLGLG